jgi:excisionase family DNA binding protein
MKPTTDAKADLDLLTIKEAAGRLRGKVSANTLYLAVETKRLPHYRVSGSGRRGKILIREADLHAWLEGMKVTPAEPDEWL